MNGYGVIQPRVGTTLASTGRSLFARVYGGRAGIDPYTTAVSDVYQDLFARGRLHRQGALRRRRVRGRPRRAHPREPPAQPRSLRGPLRPHRPRHRRRAARRSALRLRGAHGPAAPLGPRRLAARVLAPALGAAARRRDRAQRSPAPRALEDLRQPPPQPPRALDGRRSSCSAWLAMPRTAGVWTGGRRPRAGDAPLSPGSPRRSSGPTTAPGRARSSARCGGICAPTSSSSCSPRRCMLDQALLMLDAIGRTLYRVAVGRNLLEWMTASDAERRSARRRRPAAPPHVARLLRERGPRGGDGDLGPARALPLALPILFAWALAPLRRRLDQQARRAAGEAALGRQPDLPPPHRAQDLALLRRVRDRRGPLAAAGQLPGGSQGRHRPPDLAHQHRPLPALHRGRPRLRLRHPRRAGDAPREHARHDRRAGAPRRARPQLVRDHDARSPSRRATSPPSTAATSRPTSGRWRRPAASSATSPSWRLRPRRRPRRHRALPRGAGDREAERGRAPAGAARRSRSRRGRARARAPRRPPRTCAGGSRRWTRWQAAPSPSRPGVAPSPPAPRSPTSRRLRTGSIASPRGLGDAAAELRALGADREACPTLRSLALLDGEGGRAAALLGAARRARRAGRRSAPTACASACSTTRSGSSSPSATTSSQGASTPRTTICSPRRPASPAWSPSPRARSRRSTGSASAASSPPPPTAARCSPGAGRCSST